LGIGAAKNTPPEIIDKLNKEINLALVDAKFRARLDELGAIPFSGSPSNYGTFIANETEKLAKVVKYAGMRPD
jgi:tripartite-type tricarboxylate transporter receptor subunit TctC